MQILLSAEQKRQLDEEAARTGVSAAAIVRAALDARLASGQQQERQSALRWFREQHDASPSVPASDDPKRLIDESHTAEILRGTASGREPV